MNRRVIAGVGVLLVGVLAVLALSYGEVRVNRGPYLQASHQEGVTVVWRTNRPIESPRVVIRTGDGALVTAVEGEAIIRRSRGGEEAVSGMLPGGRQYEARITGLEPGTQYAYAIQNGEDELTGEDEELRFKTHPRVGQAVATRVWVVGDSGTDDGPQQMVYEAMRRFTAEDGRDIDHFLHLGDIAYSNGTNREFQKSFFRPYVGLLKNTVCWAAFGNHDGKASDGEAEVGPYFDAFVCPTEGEAGGVPSGSESYYSFDHGDIHFISLNSFDIDRSPEGKMAQWLVRDLEATQAQWIVGFWHHPPYSKGSHDSDRDVEMVEMREWIMPIMENGGVDLVLSGHSHIYERSMLIDGAYTTPTISDGVVLDDGDGREDGDGAYLKSNGHTAHNGTVAVVAGNGGALSFNLKGVEPLMRKIVQDHGSMILDIDGNTLTGIMLDLHGKERDRFVIRKAGVVLPHAVEKPWAPDASLVERTGSVFENH